MLSFYIIDFGRSIVILVTLDMPQNIRKKIGPPRRTVVQHNVENGYFVGGKIAQHPLPVKQLLTPSCIDAYNGRVVHIPFM